MQEPGISIVIPSRNGADRLPATLESLASQKTGCRCQVIVVDDGSSDATGEVAARFALPDSPAEVIRRAPPGGRAAACNSGLAAARAPVVIILDDDMSVRPGALEAHHLFHRDRTAAVIGRILLPAPARPDSFTRFLAREEANRERLLMRSRENVPFALCLTGHFSAPRQVLLDAGGYDASITRYGLEDIELGSRLAARGVPIVYLPEAAAVHRAYMTDLDRYLERHVDVGIVARQLAGRTPDGPLREYLRVDGPSRLGLGEDAPGLVALRMANRLLLRRWFRRLLGSRSGMAVFRAGLAAGEAAGLDRPVHFGYQLARDLRYFQGYFGEYSGGSPGESSEAARAREAGD